MATFIVRVELRNSESADYDELHKNLAIHQFWRYSLFHGDNTYWLPNAEYSVSSNESIYYIGHLAKGVAEKIRPNPKILVTEVDGLFQIGLDKF